MSGIKQARCWEFTSADRICGLLLIDKGQRTSWKVDFAGHG